MLSVIDNIKILVLVLGVLCVWFSWGTIKQKSAEFMPVRYVRVEGEFNNISKQKVQKKLMPLVSSGYLIADIQAIHQAAEALPWVRTAVVKRVWPDAFIVRLYEHQAVARWSTKRLLNKQGELFDPENIAEFASLAVIVGAEGQQKKLLEEMQALNLALQEQSLALQKFIVSDRLSWQVELVNGTEIKLGRKQPKKNFQRLLAALPILGVEKVGAIATVDLRYPNGFSVAWKPGTKIDWTDEIKRKSRRRET